ncbi:MAG TPA: HAMP domain-containing sensor histidine kinase [Paludibaculum sp.]|jgi:signal transduction histidine kinase
MGTETQKRRSLLSWLTMGTLLVLCAVLGGLQYYWVGELSLAERHRLKSGLQASLNRLSRDFNSEISGACATLLPSNQPISRPPPEEAYTARYLQLRESSQFEPVFRAVARAVPQGEDMKLRQMDMATGLFHDAEWPENWQAMRRRLQTRWNQDRRDPYRSFAPGGEDLGMLLDIPRFAQVSPGTSGIPPVWRTVEWLIFELQPAHIRDDVLPELLRRHLGVEGSKEFQVELVTKASSPKMIFASDGTEVASIGKTADASVNMLDLQYERILRRGIRAPATSRTSAPEWGRWTLSARHHAGSLEAVVDRARWRNLSVTGGILLLMLATVFALIRYTQRAQKLAELQMDFVAGVSHELRTPLTVIHTAAYNLRGRMAQDPARVVKYGALIQQESERLRELVERVLRFAGAQAGQVIHQREAVSLEAILDDSLAASASVLESAHCCVERKTEPDLPLVMADAVTLKHAFINLLSNAAKYGCEGNNWIGISAITTGSAERSIVEVRIADHGPGIPPDEQAHIFEPFFRGRRAVMAQTHGTGLGLSLVKGIVEAHEGTIEVESEPGAGTVFTVRIPAAPVAKQDECTSLTN